MIKQLLQYKWSNKSHLQPFMSHGALRSWMIPGLAGEHSYPEGCMWKTTTSKGLKTGFRLIIHQFKIKTFGIEIIKCSQKAEKNSIDMTMAFCETNIMFNATISNFHQVRTSSMNE